MTFNPESSAKLGPLGRDFRGVSMASAYSGELLWQALRDSLVKFDPRTQIHNPVMFVVWVGMLVTLALTVEPSLFGQSNASHLYNGVVTVILALTVWFANYAEALAEGRGKAKAESLRHTRANLTGVRVHVDGRQETVSAAALRIGDRVRVEREHLIPADGEVVEGVAYVNEAAITASRRRTERAWYGYVLFRHGRDHGYFGLAARPRDGESGPQLPGPYDPARGSRETAKVAERDRAYRAAFGAHADLPHRGRRDCAGRHLS